MSDKALNKVIAFNILRLLTETGHTQQELAQFLNVTQGAISAWCSGRSSPRVNKLGHICSFYGVRRIDLMLMPGSVSSTVIVPDVFELDLVSAFRSADQITKEMALRILGLENKNKTE